MRTGLLQHELVADKVDHLLWLWPCTGELPAELSIARS
jgi:hypothetical protein